MNTPVKEKINRLGKVGQIITTILIVLAIIYCVTVAYSSITQVIQLLHQETPLLDGITATVENLDPAAVSEGNAAVSSFTITPDPDRSLMTFDIVYSVITIVLHVAWVVVLFFLKRVMDGFSRCDSPFEDNVIRRMNEFAWILLGFSVFNMLFELGAGIFSSLSPSIQFMTLTGLPDILDLIVGLSTRSFTLVAALALLFLVQVFRHGAELQREVDETL